ncbi:MAG TPA: heavy metal-responsive transcriptional regulator [Deltaproteobacteria bacterium]|nr:heavy metal-responsive transcriptional regulator [Deltaproteobacteria bacterium]
MEKRLTIGETARRAGVNLQTIRYYERKGLLLPAGRTASGYRLYDEDALKRLLFIRHAKELGFTLEEIRGLMELRVGSGTACGKVRERAGAKLASVERKIEALKTIRRILRELIDACGKRRPTEECPILKAIEERDLKAEKEKKR